MNFILILRPPPHARSLSSAFHLRILSHEQSESEHDVPTETQSEVASEEESASIVERKKSIKRRFVFAEERDRRKQMTEERIEEKIRELLWSVRSKLITYRDNNPC